MASDRTPIDLLFVLRHHHANTLHYDFRILCGNVLLSWMFFSPPLFTSGTRIPLTSREDHDPLYMLSERRIPEGLIGAGPTIVSDTGSYLLAKEPKSHGYAEVRKAFEAGLIDLDLRGRKLDGEFRLKRMDQEHWYMETLNVRNPDFAWNDISIISGLTVEDIEREYQSDQYLKMLARLRDCYQESLFWREA